jgi:hypothetical protein
VKIKYVGAAVYLLPQHGGLKIEGVIHNMTFDNIK